MRILFVTDSSVSRARGGAEVSAFNLALGLRDQGHEVHLATIAEGSEPYEAGFLARARGTQPPVTPVSSPYLETGITRSISLSRLVADMVNCTDFDIVHAHNWVSGFAAHLARSRVEESGIPWVLSVRDYRFLCPATYGWCFHRDPGHCDLLRCASCIWRHTPEDTAVKVGGILPYSVFRNASWRILARAITSFDQYVGNSRFIRNRFKSRFRVPRERVRYIHNSVEVPPDFDVRGREDEILYLGRLSIEKGVPGLLSAFRDVLIERPSCHMTIAGGGPLEEYIRRRCRIDRSLERSVDVLGYVPPEDVWGLYSEASLVVTPSIWPEPFGRIPLESMAAGRPVVASDSGGIPEVVADGRTGVLVPPGDTKALTEAMVTILSDDALRARMGRNGRKRAHRFFSNERIAGEFATLYKDASEG